MAEDSLPIDKSDEKKPINNDSLAVSLESAQEANANSTHDVGRTLPEYLSGWRLHLLTIAFVISVVMLGTR